MKIKFKLYASLAECLPPGAKDNTAEIEVPTGLNPIEVMNLYRVPLAEVHLVLVNGVFITPCKREEPLQAGDQLAIWPAVAGG